ncbi:hypothetical protein [Acidithiobacillus ferriphilus]|uniref:hypothetical protein n=1 Tax=Acidithiobacillus ferriphilus TaxID=1689834 RepID=UPI00242B320B|nr:hypothetical protein [Acidithiobacillus ferriphilus]
MECPPAAVAPPPAAMFPLESCWVTSLPVTDVPVAVPPVAACPVKGAASIPQDTMAVTIPFHFAFIPISHEK